jgi:hypothetical protein
MAVQVECGRRLAFGTFSGHGVHNGPDCGPGEECGGFGVVFAVGRRESGRFKSQQLSVSGEVIFQVSGVKCRKRMGSKAIEVRNKCKPFQSPLYGIMRRHSGWSTSRRQFSYRRISASARVSKMGAILRAKQRFMAGL